MRKGLKKAYEITDAKISFVSLVDKAAMSGTKYFAAETV